MNFPRFRHLKVVLSYMLGILTGIIIPVFLPEIRNWSGLDPAPKLDVVVDPIYSEVKPGQTASIRLNFQEADDLSDLTCSVLSKLRSQGLRAQIRNNCQEVLVSVPAHPLRDAEGNMLSWREYSDFGTLEINVDDKQNRFTDTYIANLMIDLEIPIILNLATNKISKGENIQVSYLPASAELPDDFYCSWSSSGALIVRAGDGNGCSAEILLNPRVWTPEDVRFSVTLYDNNGQHVSMDTVNLLVVDGYR
ncbi:hypothetical protein [Thalassospira tepidiphila]|uniref:hypothetical protein n=1 Tax=Thalassospira tepidiphila TaxID=393657 RepID=UPI0030C6E2C7